MLLSVALRFQFVRFLSICGHSPIPKLFILFFIFCLLLPPSDSKIFYITLQFVVSAAFLLNFFPFLFSCLLSPPLTPQTLSCTLIRELFSIFHRTHFPLLVYFNSYLVSGGWIPKFSTFSHNSAFYLHLYRSMLRSDRFL